MEKLELLSACELGKLVNKQLVKPTDIITYFKERIIEKNKEINAFTYTMFDEAMLCAKKQEEQLKNGEKLGPFAGVPFALKDFLPNKIGWQSSHGGVKCMISIDSVQSVFCQAMENLGAIAIGKCNAPSYGFRATTDNKLYGPTKNPFNLLYNAGGSSGGSAAAISSGLAIIAEGGDAGGSIRIPAAYTNLFGFKAGIATIPSVNRPDAFSASHPYCFNGGLTKTVEDCAILLDEMSYYDSRDPNSRPLKKEFVKALDKSIIGARVAYTLDFDLFPVDNEVRVKFYESIKALQKLGISLNEVHFKFKHEATYYAKQWCRSITVDPAIELNLEKQKGNDLLKQYPNDFPSEFRYYKEECDKMGIMDLYELNLVRTEILDEFENVFKDYDFLISPVSIVKGVLNTADFNTKGPDMVNGVEVEPLIGFTETFLVNFSGHPAASIPFGFFSDNLPFGLQVIVPKFKDESIISFASLIEKHFPWRLRYPY